MVEDCEFFAPFKKVFVLESRCAYCKFPQNNSLLFSPCCALGSMSSNPSPPLSLFSLLSLRLLSLLLLLLLLLPGLLLVLLQVGSTPPPPATSLLLDFRRRRDLALLATC